MKNYSKLRPFDLEAAKAGGNVCGMSKETQRTYVAGPDSSGWICFMDENGVFVYGRSDNYRMAPLAWVRKSSDEDVLWPVYKRDVLYYAEQGYGMAVEGYNPHVQGESGVLGEIVWRSDDCAFKIGTKAWAPWDSYTFTPPKVKREGWVSSTKPSW